jgi:hypothetical protein
MLNGTGRLGDSGEDGEICYSSGCWDFWDLMNAAPITSAAPAVHQELIGTLAERTRIHRLRDQQQRRWDQPQPAQSGAERRPAASHDEPDAGTDLSSRPSCCRIPSPTPSVMLAWTAAGPFILRRGRLRPGTAAD